MPISFWIGKIDVVQTKSNAVAVFPLEAVGEGVGHVTTNVNAVELYS